MFKCSIINSFSRFKSDRRHCTVGRCRLGKPYRLSKTCKISPWLEWEPRASRVPHKDICKIYTAFHNRVRFNSFHMRQIYVRTDAPFWLVDNGLPPFAGRLIMEWERLEWRYSNNIDIETYRDVSYGLFIEIKKCQHCCKWLFSYMFRLSMASLKISGFW